MVNADEEKKWAYLLAPTFQCLNTSGKPLTEGWIEVYIHGTRNKYYCASDFSGTLHPFKIPLDSLGANIILASPLHSYDVYVYNKFGSLSMSRYNIVPATNVGEAIADIVTITSDDQTVDVDVSGGTTWNLSIKNTVDALQEEIDGKKDLQEAYEATGSVTKTITNITQDENGEINVTYEDIDLPPEVPTVEITSPNDTIQISSSTNPETNVKTFEIDVKNSGMEYFDGYTAHSHYEDRESTTHMAYATYLDQWANYEYNGNFIINDWQATDNVSFILKPGIYLVHAVIRYSMNNTWSDPSNPNPSKSNSDEYIRIATGAYNGLENGTVYKDWSHEYELDENTITMSFVRTVIPEDGTSSYIRGNSTLYFYPYLPYGVNYAYVEHLQVVKLDSAIAANGTEYVEGQGIKILNDVISVREGAGLKFSGNDLMVNTGSGINIVDDKLVVNAGTGINIVDNKVVINESYLTQLIDNQFITEISNIPGSGLSVDEDNKLNVNVGSGLQIVNGDIITINPEVGDVVDTVEKLKKDLDTQITPNFDMPNISQFYDFADPSVSTLANGACMLCQAFTIPINHEIRTLSEDANEPTLFGIYSQQGFGHKIMLALYEYTYAKAGEEHGSSTYVGDTGPVNVVLGVNEYPLKNRNPSITELRSDRVYYATLYLPNAARVNGLTLAGAPNYGTQSVPAEPRLSCAVENITWNNQELDMDDPTTTLNHYQTYTLDDVTYYNYYIGPWNSGYNERWTAPRFYMQIRNGEYNEPIIPTAPFVDLGNVLPTGVDQVSNLPGFTPSASNSSFRDVTPLINVTITSFEWVDDMATTAGWAAANCVYDSGFATNLSGNSNTTTDLGSVGTVDGHTMYAHRITFTTPISLTANTTYRFLCECFDSSSSYIFGWTTPTGVVHVGNNGWYVVTQNLTRYDNIIGKYTKLTDSNNNSYVI